MRLLRWAIYCGTCRISPSPPLHLQWGSPRRKCACVTCLSHFVPPLTHWKRTLPQYWRLPNHLKLHTYSLHIVPISAFFFLSLPVIPFSLPTSPNNLIISILLPRCHICVYAIHLFLHITILPYKYFKYYTTASWWNLVSHARAGHVTVSTFQFINISSSTIFLFFSFISLYSSLCSSTDTGNTRMVMLILVILVLL